MSWGSDGNIGKPTFAPVSKADENYHNYINSGKHANVAAFFVLSEIQLFEFMGLKVISYSDH
jgi:hypothetical protein